MKKSKDISNDLHLFFIMNNAFIKFPCFRCKNVLKKKCDAQWKLNDLISGYRDIMMENVMNAHQKSATQLMNGMIKFISKLDRIQSNLICH